jgi:hypothetical protein
VPSTGGGKARSAGAAAAFARTNAAAAPARIHRRREQNTSGIGDVMICARDQHVSGLKRLTQRIKRLLRERRTYGQGTLGALAT